MAVGSCKVADICKEIDTMKKTAESLPQKYLQNTKKLITKTPQSLQTQWSLGWFNFRKYTLVQQYM